MTTFLAQKRKVLHDIFRAYLADFDYCIESAVIRNASGSAIVLSDPCGTPLKIVSNVWCVAFAGDESNVKGFLMEQIPIPSIAATTTTSQKFAIMVRGPGVILLDGLPALDPAGSAYTKSTIATACLALSPPIIPRSAPANTTVQST